MAGAYIKPKSFNRRFYINIGTKEAPIWAEVARGITSRGTSINETTTDYIDMASRGVVETETESIKVQRSFSGCRIFGDAAQDSVLQRLYTVNNRTVDYMSFYDNMPTGAPSGERGTANITISDDGSGDAAASENISFALNIVGVPETGTVTLGVDNIPTFTPVSA